MCCGIKFKTKPINPFVIFVTVHCYQSSLKTDKKLIYHDSLLVFILLYKCITKFKGHIGWLQLQLRLNMVI